MVLPLYELGAASWVTFSCPEERASSGADKGASSSGSTTSLPKGTFCMPSSS